MKNKAHVQFMNKEVACPIVIQVHQYNWLHWTH